MDGYGILDHGFAAMNSFAAPYDMKPFDARLRRLDARITKELMSARDSCATAVS